MSITKYLFDTLNNATELYPPMHGANEVNSYDILQGKINSNRFADIAELMHITKDTDVLIVAKSVNTSVSGGIYSSTSPSCLTGLYYIPAVLHTDGTLGFTQNKLPYFNESFMSGDIVFCNKERAENYFAANPRLISAIYGNGTWEAYIRLATAYFEEVCGVPYNECYITNRADESSFIFDRSCYIIPSRPAKGNKAMLQLYARIYKEGGESKLYTDFCQGKEDGVSVITLEDDEKVDFIRKIAVNWLINSALNRNEAKPIVIGSDILPTFYLQQPEEDLFSYWSDVKSSVQALPAIDAASLSDTGVFSKCARRYGVSFSSASGCTDRIYKELSSLSVLNDRVINQVKQHQGLVRFPVSEGKKITFAANQTLLKCQELEKMLRERKVEWEVFLKQLPLRIRRFGALESVRTERKRLFEEFMDDRDSFLDASMTPQQILNAFTEMSEKNQNLMQETESKKALLDILGEYTEYGIDFFADLGDDDTFDCTEEDANRHILKRVIPTMFWLSVHYYECVWASDKENNPYTLAPVIIAPYKEIPTAFSAFGTIPLLILDHADSISTEYAAGLFALAQSAILVCDGGESEPVHTIPAGTDKLLAVRSGAIEYADEYSSLRRKGISASRCAVADCFRS